MIEIIIDESQFIEIDEASILLSRAYSSTPIISAIFGSPNEEQQRILQSRFKNKIKDAPGKMFLAKENERVIGVMRIVEWPDCQKSSVQDLNLSEDIAIRLGEQRLIWAQHDPKEPHWHLSPIGVLPERQGQGVGSLLLEHFCRYVDGLRQPAYLETDQAKNVRFYKRFGFNVKGETTVLSIPNWFMWRYPIIDYEPTHEKI